MKGTLVGIDPTVTFLPPIGPQPDFEEWRRWVIRQLDTWLMNEGPQIPWARKKERKLTWQSRVCFRNRI